MKIITTYHSDFVTGEVYDFTRVEENLDKLPDGSLKVKLQEDLSRVQMTIGRILRNTGKRLHDMGEDMIEQYELNLFPDGKGVESLSFCFAFMTTHKGGSPHRDFNGGIIFHGAQKIFNDDLTLKEGIDWDCPDQCSISMHT